MADSEDQLGSQLLDAIAQYEEQLDGIQQLLDEGSPAADLLEMKEQLEQALQETRAAYSTSFAPAGATAAAAEITAAAVAAGLGAGPGSVADAPTAEAAADGWPLAAATVDKSATNGSATAHINHSNETHQSDTLEPAVHAPSQGQTASRAEAATGGIEPHHTAESMPVPAAAVPVQRRPGNARMHPANIYFNREPDFAALATRHPDLARFVTLPAGSSTDRDGGSTAGTSGRGGPGERAGSSHAGSSNGGRGSSARGRGSRHSSSGRATIDFTSWEATRALTAALLADDYGVTWTLQEGQLVPPVTNRANYVHWVADLLQLSSPPGSGQVLGLDVGCGANFIYCLLGAAIYGWRMVGIDITDAAISGAQANLQANPQLAHLLEVRRAQQEDAAAIGGASSSSSSGHATAGGILTPALAQPGECFHFCMCNPPFFGSLKEANQNPNTACGGTAAEMVCPGGELAFIRRMVADSVQLRGSFHWYTTMVGKKDSLKAMRTELHALGATALRTTELAQGKTSRWAIAWSFTVDRNLASQPLPRAVGHQQHIPAATARTHPTAAPSVAHAVQPGQPARSQAPPAAPSVVVPVRQASFRVVCPSQQAPKLLQALAALLTQQGAACKVDAAAYAVQAQLPLAAVAAAEQEQQQEQQEDARQTQPERNEHECTQQQKQRPFYMHGSGSSHADEAPAKRRRAAVATGQAAAANAALSIRMSLFQQQPGVFSVKASIPNSTGDATARHFAAIMQNIRCDIGLMWHVQEER